MRALLYRGIASVLMGSAFMLAGGLAHSAAATSAASAASATLHASACPAGTSWDTVTHRCD